MAKKKMTREESRAVLNEWIAGEQTNSREWLSRLKDELLLEGTSDAVVAAKLIDLINPKIKFRQLSRILDLGELLLVRDIRPLIDAAAVSATKQAMRAKSRGGLSDSQKMKAAAFIKKQAAKSGVAKACRDAADRLRTGTLPGLKGVFLDLEPSGIRSIYYRL